MLNRVLEVYKKNEVITLPLYKATRSKYFWETYNFLKESESWTKEKIKTWQLNELQKIVDYAFLNVPYYKELYTACGYETGSIKSFSDFEKLPFITKDDVKNNTKQFISKKINTIPHLWNTTSGSTDKPMKFIIDKSMNTKEEAYYYYYWEKYGYRVGERRINIRGNKVADLERKKFYSRENIRNIIMFDSDYLTVNEYFPYYHQQIVKANSRILSGYPSSIYTLAKNYEANKMIPPKFDLIILASENTYQQQIDYLTNCFKPKNIIYQYGHSEKILLAFKYKNRKELGFSPTYGYMELEKNKSQFNEIIGTSYSKSMPFIRYKTGDLASNSNYQSNDYMRNYEAVNRIEGRLHEFIYTKDNRKISLVSVAGAHIPELAIVKDMQYEQFERGKLILRITESPTKKITIEEKKEIIAALEKKFDHMVEVVIEVVSEIKKTSMNKKVMLIQHLKE